MDLRMETSQAVSMLQPFRHPNPGLIIMDKAEEKLRQHGIKPGVNITEGFFKLIIKCMDEYAQQVSREEKKHDSFWFDIFNERYPDEVRGIMDSNIYSKY